MAPESLTVWAQPISEICHALAELTLDRLRCPEAPPRNVKIRSELLIRESTQPTSKGNIQ
jgi:DNA-binding LacI/PurR family transcriptional regulator